MMYGLHDGHGGSWMLIIMPLLWIAPLGFTIWVIVRVILSSTSQTSENRTACHHGESPEEILDRRFASGEIDAEAHTADRKHLKSHPR